LVPYTNLYEELLLALEEHITGLEYDEADYALHAAISETTFGEDENNDFVSLNNSTEIPQKFEKAIKIGTLDLLHVLTGLDSPELGALYPSFDITIPIKSLWLVGIFYYNPETGGTLMVDLEAF
jgi:hypothetical protein